MNKPDDLLDALTADLKPVRALRLAPVWGGAAAGLLAAALYVFCLLGPRPEITALLHGAWVGNWMAVLKPLLFLVTGLSALWAVSDLVRPEGYLRLRTLLPVMAALGLVFGNLASELATKGVPEMMVRLHDPMLLCWVTIFCGGMAGLAVLWRLFLCRCATSHPVLLGAMSAMATASLMASAYAIHCDRDAAIYILAIYYGAVGIFTALGALLGRKFLSW